MEVDVAMLIVIVVMMIGVVGLIGCCCGIIRKEVRQCEKEEELYQPEDNDDETQNYGIPGT